MKISIASDHAGIDFKEIIKNHLLSLGQNLGVVDIGPFKTDSVDYPDYAKKLSVSVANKDTDLGILICGTGIGMSIAANKIKGIRAALVHNVFTAKMARQHNNANILCLGSRILEPELAISIVDEWLNTDFEAGRHQQRLNKIVDIENGG